MQTFSSTFLSSGTKNCQKRKIPTAGLQAALRTDAVTMNNSILEGSCSSDSLQNIPFSSLSSAFPYLSPHLTCSTRLTFYLTATALVCVGVDGDEVGFSSKKIKRERMMVAQRQGESDRLLKLGYSFFFLKHRSTSVCRGSSRYGGI